LVESLLNYRKRTESVRPGFSVVCCEGYEKKLMKKFKVQLQGENFLLNLDGELKKYGFYATKFVRAESPQEAEKIAVILMHQNPTFRETVLNGSADPPKIGLEEIKEVGFLKFFAKKSTTGVTFYLEDEE
jgi:hypothetical protein